MPLCIFTRLLPKLSLFSVVTSKDKEIPLKTLTTTGAFGVAPGTTVDVRHSPWIERRIPARFRLLFPVVFHWKEEKPYSGVGYSRNIGLGGVLIVSSYCPPLGSQIEIDVVVPAFDRSPKEILFRHTGRVVRIQPTEDLLGFAVAGEFENETSV
jgi:hypothetical protein